MERKHDTNDANLYANAANYANHVIPDLIWDPVNIVLDSRFRGNDIFLYSHHAMDSEDFQKLLNYAYFFLKFRPRSKKEVENYLYKKIQKRHWSQDDVKKVVQHLEELDLINDSNFVKWFIEQRMLLKPKGTFVLKQELLKHGVDKEIIEEYFSSYSVNEKEQTEKILRKRWHRYKNLDKRKRFEKAMGFLLRRGFSFDISKQIIQKLEVNI